MAVELTPRVAQQTAGLGFQVPVFRMNQGVSAATANPMSRAAMQPMEMISEGQFGLNPNVIAMADEEARSQFFSGVDELNQFVNRAAEFGIDPSKVDMSVPESFALNQEFRKRVQALQQQARAISTGAAQVAIAEREANRAYQALERGRAEEEYAYQQGRRKKADILEGLGGEVFENEFRILDALSKEGITRGDVAAQNEFRARAASSIPALEQAYAEGDDQAKRVIKPYLDKAKSYSQGKGIVFAPPPKGDKVSDWLGLAGGDEVAELGSPLKIASTQSVKPVPVDPTFDTGLMSRGVPSFEATGPISILSINPRPMYYIDGPGGEKTPFSQEEFDALLPAQKRKAKLGIVGAGTAEFSPKSILKIGDAPSSQKVTADVMVVIPEEMYGQIAKAKYPGTSAKAKAQQNAEIKRLKSLTEPKVRFDKSLLTQ